LDGWHLVVGGSEGFELLKNRVTSSAIISRKSPNFIGDSLLGQDGPTHRRMRFAMNTPFTPRGITASHAGEMSREVIERRAARLCEGPLTILPETQSLALHIIFRVLGVRVEQFDLWTRYYQELVLAAVPVPVDLPLLPLWRARRGRAWLDARLASMMNAF